MTNLAILSSAGNGFGGLTVNYEIVKDFALNYELEPIPTMSLIKRIIGSISKG